MVGIGLQVPDCEYRFCCALDDSGEYTVWFVDPSSRSWASIDYVPGADTYEVNQLGPRQLWDEVEAAYTWWVQANSPTSDQWRFTITPTGQHVDLTGTPAASTPRPSPKAHEMMRPAMGRFAHTLRERVLILLNISSKIRVTSDTAALAD